MRGRDHTLSQARVALAPPMESPLLLGLALQKRGHRIPYFGHTRGGEQKGQIECHPSGTSSVGGSLESGQFPACSLDPWGTIA